MLDVVVGRAADPGAEVIPERIDETHHQTIHLRLAALRPAAAPRKRQAQQQQAHDQPSKLPPPCPPHTDTSTSLGRPAQGAMASGAGRVAPAGRTRRSTTG